MMTDSLADMLTRIRNANRIERPVVDMPATRFKVGIAQVLKDEGFIIDYHVGVMTTAEEGQPAVFQQQPDAGVPQLLRQTQKFQLSAIFINCGEARHEFADAARVDVSDAREVQQNLLLPFFQQTAYRAAQGDAALSDGNAAIHVEDGYVAGLPLANA